MRPEDNVDDTDRDFSFLAPPGEVMDWRLVLLHDAADAAGLLEALPGRPPELAARLGLDPQAVGVVLAALALYGVVEADGDGGFSPGPEAPGPDATAVLSHHARALRHCAAGLSGRLGGADAAAERPPPVGRWLDGLAVYARKAAPEAVDACLAHAPRAASVLDLGGGHGVYSLEFARRGLAVTMQDRPETIDLVRDRGVLEAAGVELFAGDLFEALPTGPFDLVFCAGVTNGLGPDGNIALAQRVRSCLASGGHLVIQSFMPDRHPPAALFGVQMLLVGGGADAHPESRHREWLAAAGYGPVDAVDIEGGRRALLFARSGSSTTAGSAQAW